MHTVKSCLANLIRTLEFPISSLSVPQEISEFVFIFLMGKIIYIWSCQPSTRDVRTRGHEHIQGWFWQCLVPGADEEPQWGNHRAHESQWGSTFPVDGHFINTSIWRAKWHPAYSMLRSWPSSRNHLITTLCQTSLFGEHD